MVYLVYFSSATGYTARFVEKLGFRADRIPVEETGEPLIVDEDYVLVTPTYSGGTGEGAVPKQVIHFLNNPQNRSHIKGVIAGGNTNFGSTYGLAGDVIAAKTHTPLFYKFEMLGTPADVHNVREGLQQWWND